MKAIYRKFIFSQKDLRLDYMMNSDNDPDSLVGRTANRLGQMVTSGSTDHRPCKYVEKCLRG